MKNRLCRFAFLVLACTFVFTANADAKSYTIPIIRVEVDIRPDGTVRITEHHTYQFDGSFNWADYRLPLKGYSEIRNIRVSENGKTFINKNNEKPGTFMVETNDEQIRVKWFYEAEDERRTFTISYTLEDALVIGPEWTEFFWNYLSSDREKETDSLHINANLPQAVPRDSLYFWKRDAVTNINLNYATNGYTVRATNIDDDESVLIRAVFPRRVFNQDSISTTNQDFTLQWAQNDEEAYQERLEYQQQLAEYGYQLTILVSILSIGVFILLYQKYGKRHSARGVSSTPTIMIPGRLKPAAAGWLLDGRTIGSGLLVASLLDLARRGYYKIEEMEPEEQWLGSEKKRFKISKTDTQPDNDLTEWEASLKNYINEQIEERNQRLEKLFNQSTFSTSSWFSEWKSKLKTYCKKYNWYDQASYKGLYINLIIQILFIGVSILAIVWTGPIGTISLFISAFMLMASFAIIRRTPEGEQMYKRWNAYKEGLKNAADHSIKTDAVDKHFIYAIAFGLSKGDIKSIFTKCSDDEIAIYWFVFYGTQPHSAADIADTFTNMGATGAAAFPGASSGTAGATAGSAGGGAAGGAG